jgi:hypothetical protein
MQQWKITIKLFFSYQTENKQSYMRVELVTCFQRKVRKSEDDEENKEKKSNQMLSF